MWKRIQAGWPIPILAAAFALSGCQTDASLEKLVSSVQDTFEQTQSETAPPSSEHATTPTPANGKVSKDFYSLFFDQNDHMKELLDSGELSSADQLFIEQRSFFSSDTDKSPALLEQLASGLKENHLPPINAAIRTIEAASWPADFENWPQIRNAIEAGKSRIEAFPDKGVLSDPHHRPTEPDRLASLLAELKQKITATATDQFTQFDHFSDRSFFDIYPVDIDRSAMLDANDPNLKRQLETADTGRLEAFARNYDRSTLGTERWARLGERYVHAVLEETGNTRNIATILGALKAAKKAGFEPKTVNGLNIGFVEVTSKTLLREGQIDFPASIDIDLPVSVTKAELETALSDVKTHEADFLVVFDVALAKASRRVLNLKPVMSTVLTGYSKTENPQYRTAEQNVEIAKINFNQASIQASGYHGAGLAGAFSQMISGIAQGSARDKLQQAMKSLANTPKTLDEPVYQKYAYKKATIQARKAMTVHYYVIDRRQRTYFKSTFDVNEEKRFNVAYNIEANDPKKTDHAQAHDTEKDVDDFEKAETGVKLSQLIDHYLANRGTSRKLSSMTALRKEMLRDKNKVLAAFKANTFDARPLNDPRFDSVVAVYAGKGALGSGFYIKPDVVLTNWHVVEEAKFVEMKTYDGQETFGKILGKDVRLDLALVRVQNRGKPVRFYSNTSIDLGSTAEAIGHPQGHEFSVTRGIVSAVRKEFSINLPKGAGDKVLYIQTDAPISGGNSGGPLFLGDRVIGVNTWTYVGRNKTAQNLNFAIHYSEVLQFVHEHLPGTTVLTN